MQFPTVSVLNIPFINTTNQAFIAQLSKDLATNENRFIVTANPEIALYATKHNDYFQTISQADYITPDGIGILKGATMLGTPLTERITGFDTMTALFEIANQNSYSVYLLGAKEEVLQAACQNVAKQYPNVTIVGQHNGYFDDQEEQKIVADIERTQPNIILAALGFPKQETFIEANRHKVNAIWMGVGGSFDVLSGTVSRAPKIWQKMHLEWFYRFASHPSRLNRFPALIEYMRLVKKEKKN